MNFEYRRLTLTRATHDKTNKIFHASKVFQDDKMSHQLTGYVLKSYLCLLI